MDEPTRPTLGFIGTGPVATALAQSLAVAGYRIAALHGRDAQRAAALAQSLPQAAVAASRQAVADGTDLVLLAVPDDAIASVADSIAWRPGQAVVHCNGAATRALLAGAEAAGADVGVFHPLQSLPHPNRTRERLKGCTFRVEASSARLSRWLEDMAHAVGGRPLALDVDPTLYHASAVLASNCLVALLDLASELWAELGVPREEGLRALLPLVRGTIANVEEVGIPAALTGPIARGDVGTVAHHLAALNELAPSVASVYKQLGLRAVELAVAKGTLGPDGARRLRELLAQRERGTGGVR